MKKTKNINSTALFLIIIIAAGILLFLFQMNLLSPKKSSMNKNYRQALEKMNSGDYKGAEVILKKLIEEDPKNLNFKNSLGFVYANTGRRKLAVNIFKEIIETNKHYDKAYANLGAIYESYAINYEEANEIEKAIDFYEMAKSQYQKAIKSHLGYNKIYSNNLKNVENKLKKLYKK